MPDPRPTPPQDPDDAVRRLLAQARHDEPLPDDVAERLDRVLAGLADETDDARGKARRDDSVRSGADDDAGVTTVTSLDVRRRRRRAGQLLVAAAVVLVAGVGIARGITDSDDAPNTASSVQRQTDDTAGGDQSSARSPSAATSVAPAPSPSPTAGVVGGLHYAQIASRLPVTLRSDALRRDLRRTVILAAQLEPALQDDGPVATALADGLAGWSCGTGTSTKIYGDGVLLPATYDGRPVVLALRSSPGDGLPVEVLACGSGKVLRTVTVDAT